MSTTPSSTSASTSASASAGSIYFFLNDEEKLMVKGLHVLLTFEAGLAVCEKPQNKKSVLEEMALEEFQGRVKSINLLSPELLVNFTGKGFRVHCRPGACERVRTLVYEQVAKTKHNAAHVWRKFQETKSALNNWWGPGFEFHSGDNLDDAIDRARQHAWAQKYKKPLEEAPEPSIKTLQPEIFTFKKHREHYCLQNNNRMKRKNTSDESGDEKEEASIVQNAKSRKHQRSMTKSERKKRVESIQKRNIDVASQAVSGRIHANAMANKNSLEFLKLAQASNMYSDEEIKFFFDDVAERMCPSLKRKKNDSASEVVNVEDVDADADADADDTDTDGEKEGESE